MGNITSTFSLRNVGVVKLLNRRANGSKAETIEISVPIVNDDRVSLSIFDTLCRSLRVDAELPVRMLEFMLLLRSSQLGNSDFETRISFGVTDGVKRSMTANLRYTDLLEVIDITPGKRLYISWFLKSLVQAEKDVPNSVTEWVIIRGLKDIVENRLTAFDVSAN